MSMQRLSYSTKRWYDEWIAIKFREKTLTLQGDARGVSSVVTWFLTTEETRE